MKKVTEKKSIGTQHKDHTQRHIQLERVRTVCADRLINKNARPHSPVRRRLARKQTDRVFGRNEARSSPCHKRVGVRSSEYSTGSRKRRMPSVASIAVLMNHHTESRPLVSCWPPITPGTGAKCVGREFPALPGKPVECRQARVADGHLRRHTVRRRSPMQRVVELHSVQNTRI